MDYKQIGKRFRWLRKRADLTQEMAAEFVDISPSFMGHIERGTRIMSLDTFVRLCNLYRVSTDAVLGIKRQKL